MAGHSHWKSIKHKKGAADAKRGKLFSKLAKYIMVAARNGGANPDDNLRLRYAIDKARAESMPKDSIERAVKKGAGELQGEQLEELVYEGIGPEGVSFVLEALTDNRNRTGGELRHLLEKHSGSLGKSNSAVWKYDRKGVLGVSALDMNEEELFEVGLEAGAENIEAVDEETFIVYTQPDELDKVRSELQSFIEKKRGGQEKKWGDNEEERPLFTRAELVYEPQSTIPVQDVKKAQQVLNLMSELEDHEDIQNIYSDFDIPDDVAAQLD